MRKIYLYKGKLFEEIHDFRYTGDFQEFHLDKGKYLMLCDGARSENPGTYNYRAYGGRAMGILDLKDPSTFYAAVGGEGKAAPNNTSVGLGGWNGGGNGGLSYSSSYICGFGGSGASDIRMKLDSDFITEPIFSSKYVRLRINANKANNEYYQMSEWIFYDKNDNVIPIKSISASLSDTEMVPPPFTDDGALENLIDGSSITKLVSRKENMYSSFINIYFEFNTVTDVMSYNYVTGNDFPDRDPISWRIYVSDDNTNWTLVDKRVRESITDDRNTPTQIFKKQEVTDEDLLFPDIILPDGYEQVRYVCGVNNNSAIVTDYRPTNTTDVEFIGVSEPTHRSSVWECLFGTRTKNNISQFCFGVCWETTEIAIYLVGSKSKSNGVFIYNELVRVRTNGSSVSWYNGSNLDNLVNTIEMTEPRPTSSSYNLCVMGSTDGSNSPNPGLSASGKCYGFKIFENDVIVRNYVPVINYNGTCGLYCTITGKFHEAPSNYFKTNLNYRANGLLDIPPSNYTRIIVGGGAGGPSTLDLQNLVTNVEWIASGGGTIGTPAGGETSSKSFASQSSGYSFGIGQEPTKRGSYSYGCAGAGGGGGGWFGGYSDAAVGNYSSGSGGGGSSYVLTESSWKPDGYLVGEEFYLTDPFMDTGVAEYARVIVAKEISTLMKDDEIYAFCTGEMEKLPLNGNSKLQIECYGGAGGARVQYSMAAKGGYAKGTVNIGNDDEIYITVGGTGLIHNVSSTTNNQRLRPTLSFNGGGMCGVRNNVLGTGGPGGGASDVRICPNVIKPKLPSEINYIKTMFYERRVEYNFEPDPGSSVPWFHIVSLKFFNGVDQINMVETKAYVDEYCTKPVTYAPGEEVAENVSLINTGTNVFACQWEGLVNVVMKTDSPITDIDSYSINLPNTLNNARLPAAWKIYVSNDGESWVLLDNRLITDRNCFGDQVFTKTEFEFKDKPTLHNRVIVAGGGGGQARYNYIGGIGGGISGGVGDSSNYHAKSGPGTQMDAPYNASYGKYGCDGVFGHGGMGNRYNDNSGHPGGGGGWFGGSGVFYNSNNLNNGSSGCGGSGYLLTKDSWKPACYGLDSKYYLSDTEMVSGGNPLPVPMTMVKITVLEYAPVSILAGDVDGIKYFDIDENKWVSLSTNIPTIEDFNNHGFTSIPNENGLMNNYRIYAISKLDSFVPDKLIYNVTPSKLKIHHTGKTSMRVRKLSVDIEYNQLETSVDVTSTKVGVGPTSHLDIDVMIDKHSVNTVEQLYSVYLEADLAVTGNRYIPPKEKLEDEETSKPVPKPGDDDYLKKYLLQVGTRDSIPRSFEQYQFNYNNQAISSVIETCSKVYNREIYTITRLTFGSTTIHRLTKYNTITKKSVIIRDFTTSLFGGYGVGDFEKFGNKFVFTPGYNNSYAYWYVYDQVNNTLTTINPNNSSYWVNAFGRSFKLNENEVVFLGRYGLITYDVIKNTYTLSSGISQNAREFAMGKKYYLVTYDSSTAYFVDKETKAVTAITLTANTATVCTYGNGKFFVVQNGWLHVYDEETKSLEKQVVVPWSNCRSILYNAGVVYVTTNNSSRVWFYHFGDQRYDSIHLPWNLTFTNNGEIMRGCIFNNSWWIGHWTMASVSYVGSAKYNFGQRYGQYQIGFNSDTIDDLEYDDRFVTKEDTHLNIHDGDITYEGTSLGDSNIRVFNVSRSDYNIYKYNSFTMIDENEI